ncbi:MAG TPA: response regulator [Gammaproteobacteria bacterium]|jgi:two-component system, chemotaxis family, chemotaxis protein CheY|uniref:Response regulator n=1 Tax=Pseudomonas cremoris TaxID=2724178 RepID=A0A7X1E252_9PSED|nr:MULTISPECIES: response regulator [Pseudomonas]MBC2385047.1 response regulator [Pseudomonas cremoris]MBC2408985.1 response regulator [Pseudomonas cremoris]OYU07743.1 MAG: two-component system response regulator [Pseudomonas sp. PGPPP1]HEC55168.1 response regulator [Gammaproteobacteria bacterium]
MAKTILIVDDSQSMRQLVKMTLTGAGHQVIEACDGRDALTKLTGQKINLIISDVNMPNLDGIGLVKAVKARNEYRFTPIIMLTTESEQSKKAEGQAAGARAWIVKPFLPQNLLAAVEKLMG